MYTKQYNIVFYCVNIYLQTAWKYMQSDATFCLYDKLIRQIKFHGTQTLFLKYCQS